MTNAILRRLFPPLFASLLARAATIAVLACTAAGEGLRDNPVYVDDSPRAWELFLRAVDQTADNPAEAVRLLQELLDEYPLRLAPATTSDQHLTSVRRRVMNHLTSHPALLERYRLIESAAAERQLERGQLERLATSRALTGAGLEALLLLGQQAIEGARFDTAGRWLEETIGHPDLDDDRAAHAWYMVGLAAHYRDDPSAVARATAVLSTMGGDAPAFTERLTELRDRDERPNIEVGVSPVDRTRTEDLSDLVAEEIWSVPLDDSLLSRRFAGLDRSQNPLRDQQRRAGDLMTAAATVAGNTVFVNQGHNVLALDRFTGRELWRYVDRHRLAAADADQALDMNFVTVYGDALVTLTGHASADERSAEGKVLCLDAGDGTLRWTVNLDRLGGIEENEGLFPHGQPVIAEGVVYVLARKVSRQYLTTCYLVAIDLESGSVAWHRHIASSGGLRRSARSLSSLLYDRGDIYVATPVGAVARVAAATGEITWLRRYNVPISPRVHEETRQPWELAAPVVADESVVAIQPGERRIIVLDRASGHEQATYPSDTAWGSPRYLLANEHSVYAIGNEIRAFRHGIFATPAWRLPRLAQSIDGRPAEPQEELEIRGRVQPAVGALIVPTLDGILVVDDETGRTMHRLPVDSIGTPVATDAQLLMAGSDSLDSFMSFRRAERMLRRRIAANPADPEPALSLLRLGSRARQLELALEAAALAMDAIADPRSRQELFDLLLEMDGENVATTDEDGRALHAMIGLVAAEPEQRVEHLLAYGRWLADRDLGEAVERYQSVLSDPMLATLRRGEGGLVHDAGHWAARRLRGLIEQHGATVYAPQADYARLRLEQLQRESGADPAALRALAREFPFADAAVDAASTAAALLVRRGDAPGALATLIDAFLLAPGDVTMRELLGRAVSVCAEQGWRDTAADLLQFVDHRGGPEVLMTFDGPRERSEWAMALGANDDVRPAPRLGVAGEGRGLDARLLAVEPTARGRRPYDAALMLDEESVVRLDAPDLVERWRAPVDDAAPRLLRVADGRVLLWLDTDAKDPRAVSLDFATGEEAWSTPPIDPLLDDPVGALIQQRGVRDQMPNGAPFDPTETIPLLRSDRLLVVQRGGGSVAFDLADVTTPLWHAGNPLEEVHLAALHDLALVMAGRQRRTDGGDGTPPTTPRIVLLDPSTGAVRGQARPLGASGVRWLLVGPLGTLVYATSEGIEAIDLATGGARWANRDYAALDTQKAWLVADRAIVEDGNGHLRGLDLAEGTISEPYELPPHGDWDSLELMDVHVVDDTVYARYRERLVAYDVRGEIIGADVITDERTYRWLLPTADGLLLVSRHQMEHVRIAQGTRQTQYTYRIYELSRNCKVEKQMELPPLTEPFEDAAIVRGGLILSTSGDAIVIPMGAR